MAREFQLRYRVFITALASLILAATGTGLWAARIAWSTSNLPAATELRDLINAELGSDANGLSDVISRWLREQPTRSMSLTDWEFSLAVMEVKMNPGAHSVQYTAAARLPELRKDNLKTRAVCFVEADGNIAIVSVIARPRSLAARAREHCGAYPAETWCYTNGP